MSFEIDKDIPLPPLRRNRSPKPKYPFGDLEIGDSFLVPGPKVANVRNAMGYFRKIKDSSKTFCTRRVDGGIRVWRLT